MYVFQIGNGFYFNRNFAFNKKNNSLPPHIKTFVKQGHFKFTLMLNSPQIHFNRQCSLINNFLKSIAQHFMHFHCTSNYIVCRFILFFFGHILVIL